jgi:uncharacterized protein involved in exopolysaccharide biosynthesis/Mrp family chromosome partitioning ATPase
MIGGFRENGFDMPLEDSIDVQSLVDVLRRQTRIIASTLIITLAAAIAYLSVTPKTFTAQTLILFDPAQKNLLETDANDPSALTHTARIESEVGILGSPSIALAVIDAAELLNDPEFSDQDGALWFASGASTRMQANPTLYRENVARSLQGATKVRRVGSTYLIELEVTSTAAHKAADLANTFAEVYITAQIEAKVKAAMSARDVLQARIDAGRQALSRAETAHELYANSVSDQPDLAPEQLVLKYGLQQEVEIARAQYQTLLSRLRELEAQARLQIADSRIVSRALVPLHPSAPDFWIVMGVALVAGLSIGMVLAVLRDHVAGQVNNVSQLADLLQAPIAATVPYIGSPDRVSDIVLTDPLSPYAEAMRQLRVSLDQGFRGQGGAAGEGRLIMITSPAENEGKTSLALALARTYALSGRKTLLIDADLRRPGVHEAMGVQPESGLLDYLRYPSDPKIAQAFYSQDPNLPVETPLSLVLGAAGADRPTDQLVSSVTFNLILRDVRRSFDRVIIDTAPLLPVVDTRTFTHTADALLLIARNGQTRRADVRSAVQILADTLTPDTLVFGALSHHPASKRYARYAARSLDRSILVQ